jgi:hypothetical protein
MNNYRTEGVSGNGYSELVKRLVTKADELLPNWVEIRIDSNGDAHAYECKAERSTFVWRSTGWGNEPRLAYKELGITVTDTYWQTFGIFRLPEVAQAVTNLTDAMEAQQ